MTATIHMRISVPVTLMPRATEEAKKLFGVSEPRFSISVSGECESLSIVVTALSMQIALARSLRPARYLQLMEAGIAQMKKFNWKEFSIRNFDGNAYIEYGNKRYPQELVFS